jgi:hypothetical protein
MLKAKQMILFKKILKQKTLEFKQSDAYKEIITNKNKEVKNGCTRSNKTN